MMTAPTFALYFTSLFALNMALKQTSLHLKSVDVGMSVALHCHCRDDVAVMFYWYKQILGKRLQLVSVFYKHSNIGSFQDEFTDPRFSLDTGDHADILLKISDLRKSDSAIYHCVKSNVHVFEFCEGTSVSVKSAGLNVQALVHQSASESLQPGASVTLSCSVQTGTCDGEHDIYWLQNDEESPPGLIYSRGGRNDQCERKPNTQTQTCVFNLPVSDEKTHYCALASCAHMLFGNGTMQVSQGLSTDEGVPPLLAHVLSAALAFTTILVVCLLFSVYKMTKHSHRTDCSETFSATYSLNTQLHQDGENLQDAAVRKNKARTSRRTDGTFSECVYSSVRQ